MENKNNETFALTPIPQNERKSWWSIAFVQAGICVCVPAFLLGALLAEEMNFWPAVISGTLGYVIAIIVMCLTGMIGSDLGLASCSIAAKSFGEKGARYLVSVIFVINMIGWFGIQNKICGDAFVVFMSDFFGVTLNPVLSATIWGVIMLLTAIYGMAALEKLNIVSIPLLLIIMIYGSYLAMSQYGLDALYNEITPTMTFFQGVGLSFNFYAVGTITSSDFTRFQKSRKDTILSTTIGILPMGVLTLILGIILTRVAGEFDISVVLVNIGIPVMGILILILSTWTTNSGNAYSAGLDSVMIFKVNDDKRQFVTIIVGCIGIIFGAFGVFDSMESVLSLLSFLVCPIGGIMIADYWIFDKGNPKEWKTEDQFKIIPFVTWIISAILSYMIFTEYAGIVFAFIIYTVITKIVNNKSKAELT